MATLKEIIFGTRRSHSKFFDAHTHPHFAAFTDDYKPVIERALDKNVWMILVGTQRDTSERSVQVAHEFKEGVFAAVGLHPVHTEASYHDEQELGGGEAAKAFTGRGEEFDAKYYRKLAEDPKVVAIGECGLDYYRLEADTKKKQANVLIEQIEVAAEVKKPLMIHCRNAFPDLIKLLAHQNHNLQDPAGVIHFMTGTKEEARMLLDLGFSFTFGGVITFANDYDDVVKAIPPDRILSETDAPYVAPMPYRGKRNEPAYVVETVKRLAELKGRSLIEMQEQIWKNAKRVFRVS